MDKLKMDKLKTYGDIYDEEFLKKFGDYRKLSLIHI